MDSKIVRLKFLGALVGTAIGDAVGAYFEGKPQAEPEHIVRIVDTQDVLRYTDDTHMMIGTAESLIENNGFNGKHMAYRFVERYEREPWRGYGPGPPRIFRLISSGEAWDTAADMVYKGGSYGNGAAMRIAPVGVFYYDDIEALAEAAYGSSKITHSHPLGKEGAVLLAYAIARAVSIDPSERFEVTDILSDLFRFVQDDLYRQKISTIKTFLSGANIESVINKLGNGIEAFNSVPTAIYSFLSHHCSFRDAVVYSVSLGGDTDTIGAMTGALCGAYLGVDAIPEEWKAKLEHREYIEELALKLFELKPGT
jgi:poly(ADP-ribose) glycohydrolase ARH3